MTEQEILAEADRITRRKAYDEKLMALSKDRCQVIAFVHGEAGERFDLDAPALGMLRKYLLDKFDAENPRHPNTGHR